MMNKEYDFLRRLTDTVTAERLQSMIPSLLEEGIEVYVSGEKDFCRLVTSVQNLEAGSLCVTAADEERAREILKEQGEEELLLPCVSHAEQKNEAQIATEAYIRRQKSTYLQWLVVILIFILYIFIRRFV